MTCKQVDFTRLMLIGGIMSLSVAGFAMITDIMLWCNEGCDGKPRRCIFFTLLAQFASLAAAGVIIAAFVVANNHRGIYTIDMPGNSLYIGLAACNLALFVFMAVTMCTSCKGCGGACHEACCTRKCGHCSGTGLSHHVSYFTTTKNHSCSYCNASGRKRCVPCGGRGTLNGTKGGYVNVGGVMVFTEEVRFSATCTDCSGSGSGGYCSDCGGRGTWTTTGQTSSRANCEQCHGAKRVGCCNSRSRVRNEGTYLRY
jgi:hypothetical protein